MDNLLTRGSVVLWCGTGLSRADGSCRLLWGVSWGGNPRLCTGFVNIGRNKIFCNKRMRPLSVVADMTRGERAG